MATDAARPKTTEGPWMRWTAASCLILFLTIISFIDLNGDIVVAPVQSRFPDVLAPAPTLIALELLAVGAWLSAVHLARFPAKRTFCAGMLLVFFILIVLSVAPLLS